MSTLDHYRTVTAQAREAAPCGVDSDDAVRLLRQIGLLCDLSEAVADFRTAFHTGDDSLAEIAAVFAALAKYEQDAK